MPIKSELRILYPKNWREISQHVRFRRADFRCEYCGRPHGVSLRCLPDGRWYDDQCKTWRNARNRFARWPDLVEAVQIRVTRVILAAAHLNHDPRDNRMRNLHALCQRCHLKHDRPYHHLQRWITYRQRYALGDLFLGSYEKLRGANWIPRPAHPRAVASQRVEGLPARSQARSTEAHPRHLAAGAISRSNQYRPRRGAHPSLLTLSFLSPGHLHDTGGGSAGRADVGNRGFAMHPSGGA